MSCFMRGSAERKMPVAFFLRGTKDIKGFSVKKLSKNESFKKNGATSRNRTKDTGIFSPLLYQLS